MLLLLGQAPAGEGNALGSKTHSGVLGLTLASADTAAPSQLCVPAAAECAMRTGHAEPVTEPVCSADVRLCPTLLSRPAAGACETNLLPEGPGPAQPSWCRSDPAGGLALRARLRGIFKP